MQMIFSRLGMKNLPVETMEGDPNSIRFPVPDVPASGTAKEVGDGVLWLRFPLPFPLDHVNVYAVHDPDGWTVFDTGIDSRLTREIWSDVLSGPLKGKPVRRVVMTHHHPDHVGLVGWFKSEFGSEIWSTRVAWLTARMLTLDVEPSHTRESLEFLRRGGTPETIMEARTRSAPFNFADYVHPIPVGFRRIVDGEVVQLGGRRWTVRIGGGHAPEHATFWCKEAGLILGGDQFLADISPNIGVYPTEPEADPLSDWLTSCTRFHEFADNSALVLSGHKVPYRGLSVRLDQLIDNHRSALTRLRVAAVSPKTAAECMEVLFKRQIKESEFGLALVEAIAHFNYLYRRGEVERTIRPDGAWQYCLTS